MGSFLSNPQLVCVKSKVSRLMLDRWYREFVETEKENKT